MITNKTKECKSHINILKVIIVGITIINLIISLIIIKKINYQKFFLISEIETITKLTEKPLITKYNIDRFKKTLINNLYALEYNNYENKLKKVRMIFEDNYYKKYMNNFFNSYDFKRLVGYKEKISVIRTEYINEIKKIKNTDNYLINQTIVESRVGLNGTEIKEFLVTIKVNTSKINKSNKFGFKIIEIKKENYE
jgi:hypothetical protein